MKTVSHRLAFALAISAILAAVAVVSMKGTPSRDTVPAAPAAERARSREAPFRLNLANRSFTDPAEALQSISRLPEGERLPSEMRLAREWGRRDFAAAREWAVTSDPASRRDLLESLGRAGIASHPHQAIALAGELSHSQERVSFLSTMVQAWASADPDAATEWVGQCQPAEKGTIQTALATELAQENPRRAADYIAVSMEPGSAQDQAALTVAARWATLDPQAANAWALSLPESDLQQRVLAAVASLSPR